VVIFLLTLFADYTLHRDRFVRPVGSTRSAGPERTRVGSVLERERTTSGAVYEPRGESPIAG